MKKRGGRDSSNSELSYEWILSLQTRMWSLCLFWNPGQILWCMPLRLLKKWYLHYNLTPSDWFNMSIYGTSDGYGPRGPGGTAIDQPTWTSVWGETCGPGSLEVSHVFAGGWESAFISGTLPELPGDLGCLCTVNMFSYPLETKCFKPLKCGGSPTASVLKKNLSEDVFYE